MLLTMFIAMSIVMLVTTITMYEVFRNSRALGWFIFIIDSSPITQFIFNFGISALIMIFTGDGMTAGISNLCASILFPFYCAIRNAIAPGYRKIDGSIMYRKSYR